MSLFSSLFKKPRKVSLSENEIEFCKAIEYDQELALSIKEVTKSSIKLMPGVDEYAEVLGTNDEGLCSLVKYKIGFDYVLKSKETFKNKGYLLFFFEDDSKNAYLSIMKGTDELQIVKWRQTNGINFNLYNIDLIRELSEWNNRSKYEILGVGTDFIELKFIELPEDITKFANDIYKFCPDIIDQGVGEIEFFEKELVNSKLLQLWWD